MTTKTFDFTALNGAEQIIRTIRVVEQDGQPWFVAQDACTVLGHTNPSMFTGQLEDSEKALNFADTPGGRQKAVMVSESGRYALIMRSNKPVAKQFQNWVKKVVLPAIRKDGGYVSNGWRQDLKPSAPSGAAINLRGISLHARSPHMWGSFRCALSTYGVSIFACAYAT